MIRSFLAVGVACTLASCTTATPTGAPMKTYGYAFAPPAFYSFCKKQPRLCDTQSGDAVVMMTKAKADQLQAVNHLVNSRVRMRSDLATSGTDDVWRVPSDVGDCEDFAIGKKDELMKRGWPSSAMLLTVAYPRFSKEGHTVLTVRTSEGDLILDSLTSTVMKWSDTNYRFFARQSQDNPDTWERLS
ncbi:transglutaminase-like cysteine peptidase [Aurantimonas endophytica]|uniref:transglutaminase-like cysteine peptidase n=1 Tax=Aurantimonas endophytica TaxID=1522175 RepID=UPI003AB974D3